jgi:hypothetical protein
LLQATSRAQTTLSVECGAGLRDRSQVISATAVSDGKGA